LKINHRSRPVSSKSCAGLKHSGHLQKIGKPVAEQASSKASRQIHLAFFDWQGQALKSSARPCANCLEKRTAKQKAKAKKIVRSFGPSFLKLVAIACLQRQAKSSLAAVDLATL